jgi:hypothetical protein
MHILSCGTTGTTDQMSPVPAPVPTVVLHCVAAHSRTPTVGVAYAMSLGVDMPDALDAMVATLRTSYINHGFLDALSRLEPLLAGGVE